MSKKIEYMRLSTLDVPDQDAVHDFFGTTRANFLVLPRVALQSMPDDWQRRFVELLNDIPEVLPDFVHKEPEKYTVNCRRQDGRYINNPWPHYRHNRMFSIFDK